MYAWRKNTVTPDRLADKDSIFSTGSLDFNIRSTIIDVVDDKETRKIGRGYRTSHEADTRTFAERFRDFAGSTTFHGISNVTNNKHNVYRRMIWTILVLGMTSWLITSITETMIEYFKYPISSVISINYVENISFPAVTLCNFNQFRKSAFNEEELAFMQKIYGPDAQSEDLHFNFTDFSDFSDPEMSEHVFASVSHQLDVMLSGCVWRSGHGCTAQNFTRRFTDHGICFTFNDPENASEILQVSSAGSRNGLYLRLYVETDEYTFGENTAAGFKMLLHHQGVAPLVKELGFSVSPGFESSIAVRQTRVTSLPLPYKSNCTASNLTYSSTYTVPSCRYECKVKYIVDKCGCRDYRWPGQAPICPPDKQIDCVYPQEVEFQRQNIQCLCPVSCETTTYETRISLGYWPAGHVTDFLESNFNMTEEYVRKNFLDVYIFFEELMYVEIEQREAYTLATLQSNIGGYMGLLCGMSLVTLMEWADFTMDSIFRKCRSTKK